MNLLQHRPIDWRPLYKLKVKTCPICGKPDNCSGARDESGEVNLIYCRRPSENRTALAGKPGRDGGATFVLNPRERSVGVNVPRLNPAQPSPTLNPRRRAPLRITRTGATRRCSTRSSCTTGIARRWWRAASPTRR